MYLWQSSLPACIWRCFITSTSSFINIFHDYLSWSYSCKTDECDFYTVTWNSQSEHYPMYKMIWLDDFVVQIRNLYTKQPIRTLYPMHKMIWLDDFVEQIRNSYSKILWQSGLDFVSCWRITFSPRLEYCLIKQLRSSQVLIKEYY